MKFRDSMNLNIRTFLCVISKSTMKKISVVNFLIKNFKFYTEIHRLKKFLNSFMIFYSLIFNSLLL